MSATTTSGVPDVLRGLPPGRLERGAARTPATSRKIRLGRSTRPTPSRTTRSASRGRSAPCATTLSAFQIDWNDPQINTATPNWGFFAVANGGPPPSPKGVELQLSGTAGDHLSYGFGWAYTDAKLTEETLISPVGPTLFQEKGAPLPGAPENTLNASLDWRHARFRRHGVLIAHVDGFYQSETRNSIGLSPPVFQRAVLAQLFPDLGYRRLRLWRTNGTHHCGSRTSSTRRASLASLPSSTWAPRRRSALLRQRGKGPDIAAAHRRVVLQLLVLTRTGRRNAAGPFFNRMTDTRDGADAAAEIRRIDGLIQRRQLAEARTLCDSLLMRHPDRAEGWLLLARIQQQFGDYGMLDAARRALKLDPARATSARFTEIEARMHAGDIAGARATLTAIEDAAGADSGTWRRLAEFHTHLNQHEQAATCADPRRDAQALRRAGRFYTKRRAR